MSNHFWLVRFKSTDTDVTLQGLHDSTPSMRLCRAIEDRDVYAYVPVERDALRLAGHPLVGEMSITSLACTNTIRGESWGQAAPWHYVVETDVERGCEDEMNAWYDQEHLPGLAAVPGTVCAMRMLNVSTSGLDGSPLYHACYQLTNQDVFGSKPWLSVRGTEWSSRVRPTFRNTKRTLFRSI